MPSAEKLKKKAAYFTQLIGLCLNTPKALIVSADQVGSKQLQNIRMALRGHAVVLMGKNTMIRKALTDAHEKHPDAGLANLCAHIRGNIGFIFATNCTFDFIRETLDRFVVNAAAKAGQTSNVNVSLPAGPTGLDPSQTNFFQALNIGTKIVKGQVELTSEYQLLSVGEKVTASAQTLLQKLGIKPFSYKLLVFKVFQDGDVFSSDVLDIQDDALIGKFLAGVGNVAAFSREVGIPSAPGLPHAIGNAFRNIAALVADIDYDFEQIEDVRAFLADPDAFKAATAVAAPETKEAVVEEKPVVAVVEEEEEEEEMDFDLFG